MAIPKSYKNNVVEGKGILIFSIVFTLLIRVLYYFNVEQLFIPVTGVDGYLWDYIAPWVKSPLIAILGSCLLTAGLAFLAAHINTKYVLIRRRTLLPAAIMILVSNTNSAFILISPEHICGLMFFYVIAILFASYNTPDKQIYAFRSSFILALGSLFTPSMFIYIPLLWIYLGIMRSFNFRAFLASILSIVVIYVPVFSLFYFFGSVDDFTRPFILLQSVPFGELPFLNFTTFDWVVFVFSTALLVIILIDNYIHRHKDKIKIRMYLLLLDFIIISAATLFIFVNMNVLLNLYIILTAGALLLAHYFALAEQKATVLLFYASLILLVAVSFLPFLSM
ncbi:hypothetical protein [Dysgonomonas sp. 511]|uniref:hypothetical protein n=1 Tax=Dysgonomonas sp. 511 TaxID=2302930 RepID=UPI0013D83E60|nr:hypothetical protein [Dysgonomonas sp. 511]NDV77895.1 hypothetical protein [Dysgonomonas sp. 511]